jgi:hypothetical protein
MYWLTALMYRAIPKCMLLVRNCLGFTVDAHGGDKRIEIDVALDPRAHRFEGISVLGSPKCAVAGLPSALADVVADGVTEHARKGVPLG